MAHEWLKGSLSEKVKIDFRVENGSQNVPSRSGNLTRKMGKDK